MGTKNGGEGEEARRGQERWAGAKQAGQLLKNNPTNTRVPTAQLQAQISPGASTLQGPLNPLPSSPHS